MNVGEKRVWVRGSGQWLITRLTRMDRHIYPQIHTLKQFIVFSSPLYLCTFEKTRALGKKTNADTGRTHTQTGHSEAGHVSLETMKIWTRHQLLEKVVSEPHFSLWKIGPMGWCWSHFPAWKTQSQFVAEFAGRITHQQTVFILVLPYFMCFLSFKHHWFCN